jgi:hypothetical protein
MHETVITRPVHGHHEVAAAIFVGSLVLSAGMILSAELIKPERYEFHPGVAPTSYIIYDRHTGRATVSEFDAKNPTGSLTN